jgi:hypothetical protein
MTSTNTQTFTEDEQQQVALLSQQLIAAKSRETMAKANRIELEEKLISIVGVKSEGSSTVESMNYKITTTAKMTRSVDQESAERLREKYGREVFDLLPVKYGVNATKLKALLDLLGSGSQGTKSAFPYADELLEAITTRPAKVAVKIAELNV